jgi:hypothetical protein
LKQPGPVIDPASLFTNPAIEDGKDQDLWEFVRYLGGGNFGRAALWEKIGKNNKVIETVVVKEIEEFTAASILDQELPQEVAIQRDLNINNNSTIVYLRNYKFGHATQTGRLYMRHYEYGDLHRLYRLNLIYGHFLPEWFICEVILDFCEALKTFELEPPRDTAVKHSPSRGKGPREPDGFQVWHGVRRRAAVPL